MNLTRHFTLEEFTRSEKAAEHGIDNTPPPEIFPNLRVTAFGMECLRALNGDTPLHITSGYRCPPLNALVSKSKHSAHLDGYAADFHDRSQPIATLAVTLSAKVVKARLPFDQFILEEERGIIHVSFDPADRHEFLTQTAGGYIHGIHPKG